MNDNSEKTHITIAPGSLFTLTIVFVVLKLCNVIAWSWWWVLAPLWVLPAFVVAIFLVGAVVIGLVTFVSMLIR